MRYGIILICFLIAEIGKVSANGSDPISDDSMYVRLQQLSGMNLNIGSSFSADSLARLGRQVETAARIAGHVGREFKAGQIQVNASGLAGNLAFAASKAQELLDRASQCRDSLAMGLAIQAVGDTYLFAGRFAQADSIFLEAASYIMPHGDDFMQIELLLQHLYVHLSHKLNRDVDPEIAQIHNLLDTTSEPLPAADAYHFLLESYEAFLAIRMQDAIRAEQQLKKVREHDLPQDGFRLWVHYLESQYQLLIENYDKALQYTDSTLLIAENSTNNDILHMVLMSKAALLEKVGRPQQAGELYQRIVLITDSLYRVRYTTQIDSLHATYWIDQLQMSNMKQRSELYVWVIGGLSILVVLTILVVVVVRRKNKLLIQSRQRLEAARIASEDSLRTKSLFLSNMSHELRTPLNAITGFSSILTDDEQIDDETRQQCSQYICENADLLLKLINDVVDLSELKDQSIQFTYAPCDVVALSYSVLKTVENVKRTQAELKFVTDLQTLEIVTDKNRLQQVLINLLINATKFTQEGCITLSLHLDKQAGEAVFSVEDTGCGIPLEKQARIFERYEKLHESVQGAGLGLSICQLIVNHTGGRIWIDSSYTQGARFVFTHPLTVKQS